MLSTAETEGQPVSRHQRSVDAQTRNDLQELVVEFNWKLDHSEPAGFADLFEPDGCLETPQGTVQGSDELEMFVVNQVAMNGTSRSALSNHRLVPLSNDVIEGTVLVTSFMHDGRGDETPILYAVSEYRDVYARGADAVWRFRERRSTPVFVART